jgi:hypothetical protein
MTAFSLNLRNYTWPDRDSNPRSTILVSCTLTIAPPMRFINIKKINITFIKIIKYMQIIFIVIQSLKLLI